MPSKGLRDRALLLLFAFAFASGGRRRSEVAGADMKNLRKSGATSFTFVLAHSKTNQSGEDRPENYKPVECMAAAALAEWLSASGIAEGPIFRR